MVAIIEAEVKKPIETFNTSASKLAAFAYERWFLPRGLEYKDLTGGILGILGKCSLRRGDLTWRLDCE